MTEANYYAILPANIRYDKNLTANAKLLYAEITSLTYKTGYCYASNDYFSQIYETSQRSIQLWIQQLEEAGYINREILYKSGTKEILERRIKVFDLMNKDSSPHEENFTTPHEKNFVDNIKNKNNKKEIKEIYKESFENFWKEFPKQRAGSKEKAYTSYCRAIKDKRITESDLLEAVKLYAKSEEVERGFAKGCAAWLNDDRFNNQYKQKQEWEFF